MHNLILGNLAYGNKKLKMHKIINSKIFITLYFLVAELWKQCDYPSTGEWPSKLQDSSYHGIV